MIIPGSLWENSKETQPKLVAWESKGVKSAAMYADGQLEIQGFSVVCRNAHKCITFFQEHNNVFLLQGSKLKRKSSRKLHYN